MTKNPTDRVMTLLENADPLERIRALLAVQTATPDMRAGALAELDKAGWTRYAIAQELGITPQAAYQWPTAAVRKGRKRP